MKTINWIILRSKDRGTDYGVGTFIKQLSDEKALIVIGKIIPFSGSENRKVTL